jgi:hypothetical protein
MSGNRQGSERVVVGLVWAYLCVHDVAFSSDFGDRFTDNSHNFCHCSFHRNPIP